MIRSRTARDVLFGIGFVLAYVLMDWASQVPPLGPLNTPPWSPSAGLAVVLTARRGPGWSPLILASEMLTDAILSMRGVAPFSLDLSLLSALTTTAAYAAFGWWANRINLFAFNQTTEVVLFGLATGFAAAVAAVGGLFAATTDSFPELLDIFLKVWLSDVAGIAIGAPFFARLIHRRQAVFNGRETAGVVGLMIAVGIGALFTERPIFYPMFLPVAWAALRRGVTGAIVATALTQLCLILTAHLRIHGGAAFLSYQLVMLVLAFTGLVLGVASDARRRAESALRASREQLDHVIRAAPNAILSIDAAGRVRHANPAALRMFGEDDLIGVAFDALAPGWRDAAQTDAPRELEARRPDGGVTPVELAARYLPDDDGAVVTLMDLSARKEAELIRRDRQAAHGAVESEGRVGEVVSAIVHEVSQPLAAITAYGRAARTLLAQAAATAPAAPPSAEGGDRLSQTLERIVSQSERAGRILRRLRDYFQRPEARPEPARLGELIHEAIELCETSLQTAQVRLTVAAVARAAVIPVDRTQIIQVLANLIRNAAEAMSEAGSPKRNILIDLEPCAPGFVCVAVSDSGPGAPPHLLPRLFEPFETTRRDGMGLGLSLSRSFIDAHGGALHYRPLQGGGACFYFTIPTELSSEEASS